MTTIKAMSASYSLRAPLRAPQRRNRRLQEALIHRMISYSSTRRELLNSGLLAGVKSETVTENDSKKTEETSPDEGMAATVLKSLASLILGGYPQTPPILGPFQTIGIEELRIGIDYKIRAKVFYPAREEKDGLVEAQYLTGGLPTAASYGRLANFPAFILAHLADAKAGCYVNAPPRDIDAEARSLSSVIADKSSKFPVLIYSHGYGGNADMATYAMREISSRGIVVFAIEHTDGSASRTTLEDGTVMNFGEYEKDRGSQLEVRAKEIAATLDVVGMMSSVWRDQIPVQLSSVMDTNRLFVGGHSFGCPSAVLASKLRPNIFKGGLMHDPAFGFRNPPEVLQGATMPTFHLLGDGFAKMTSINECTRTVAANSPSPSAVYQLVGSAHGNYVDAPLWAPFWVMRGLRLIKVPAAGPVDPYLVHKIMADSAVDFISAVETGTPDIRHLNGQDPTLKLLA